jgi:hypothetical protein
VNNCYQWWENELNQEYREFLEKTEKIKKYFMHKNKIYREFPLAYHINWRGDLTYVVFQITEEDGGTSPVVIESHKCFCEIEDLQEHLHLNVKKLIDDFLEKEVNLNHDEE